MVLVISVFVFFFIIVFLVLGGLYLCFEGVEKLLYKYFFYEDEEKIWEVRIEVFIYEDVDMVVFEKDKIKGVICIDFILFVEIIVIVLGIVIDVIFIM